MSFGIPSKIAQAFGAPPPNGLAGTTGLTQQQINYINAGMKTAAPVAPAAAATSPGPSSNTPTPYLTPEQQTALDQFMTNNSQQLIDLNESFQQAAAKTQEQAGQLINGHLDNTGLIYHQGLVKSNSANDSLIARGLYQSSIRDGDLSDISTQTALRRQAMFTSLGLLQASDQQKQANLQNAATLMQNTVNNEKVANAEALPTTPLTQQQIDYINGGTKPPAAPAPPPAFQPPTVSGQTAQPISGPGVPSGPQVSGQTAQPTTGY